MTKLEELQGEFPKLFKHSCWVECGEGWVGIIRQLCVDLEKLNTTLPKGEQIWFAQIKEKWGLLRVYVHGCCEKANSLVNTAERLSGQICENCGEPGKPSEGNYWVKTLCSKCGESLQRP
jgi:hypothetical protein